MPLGFINDIVRAPIGIVNTVTGGLLGNLFGASPPPPPPPPAGSSMLPLVLLGGGAVVLVLLLK